jgi:hypothetical protein
MAYVPAGRAAVGTASVRRKSSPPIDHRSGLVPWWARDKKLVEQTVAVPKNPPRLPKQIEETRWFEPA